MFYQVDDSAAASSHTRDTGVGLLRHTLIARRFVRAPSQACPRRPGHVNREFVGDATVVDHQSTLSEVWFSRAPDPRSSDIALAGEVS
jgi:hypothetical protein